MSRNSGTGTRAKLVSAEELLLISWAMPRSPPRNTKAPTMLAAMNASATGSPIIISTSTAPIIRPNASYQGIARSVSDRPRRRFQRRLCQSRYCADSHAALGATGWV